MVEMVIVRRRKKWYERGVNTLVVDE